jgi:hypothetical protein
MLSRQFLTFGGGMTAFDLCRRWMDGETSIRHDGDLLLLGREHAHILKILGEDLEPINRDYFAGLHAKGELPLIMNYYRAAPHGPIKREHLSRTRQHMGDDFVRRMYIHVGSTFESLVRDDDVDLVMALTQSVIDFHLREFLGLEVPRELLHALACFEDHFTMGLYLRPEALDAYYGAASFTPYRDAFHSLVKQWGDKPSETGLESDFLPGDFVYNFSAAGSTNVAKGFVYGLQLLTEQEQDREPPGAEAMLRELLRFLPLVDNHVVPCFVARRPTDRGRAWLAEAGHGDIDGHVYVFHALHHADPQRFDNPGRFDPWRWQDRSSASNLMTFGVGAHACCGSRLAETWLRTLFDVWQSRFSLAAPLRLHDDPFVQAIPCAKRLTSRTALALRLPSCS